MTIFQKVRPERLGLNDSQAPQENVVNQVVELDVMKIVPNPAQPRVIFDEYELSQLAFSIQQNGILQPLTVRRQDDSDGETYELISGERRLRAAKLAGMKQVPCIIMEATSENSAVLAIMENIQRSDLNYIEEAFAIKRLIDFLRITQEEAAVKLGMAQSTVANKLRLLRLSDEEKAMVLRNRLSERQARALLRLPGDLRMRAIEKISEGGLNTALTDKLIDEMLKPPPPKKSDKKSFYVKQTELYISTFNHAIDSMKRAGIACVAKQTRSDEFIEYTVKIPLKSGAK